MIEFLIQAYALKDTVRTGWTLRGVDRPESVGDHAWGTALLCLLAGPAAGVDVARCVSMAVVHDLAECITGDFPALQDTISAEDKARLEAQAMETLARLCTPLSGLAPDISNVQALWQEYEARQTPEALLVRDLNLVDMALQALVYETQRRQGTSLKEFFVTTEARLATATGRRLFQAIAERRDGGSR